MRRCKFQFSLRLVLGLFVVVSVGLVTLNWKQTYTVKVSDDSTQIVYLMKGDKVDVIWRDVDGVEQRVHGLDFVAMELTFESVNYEFECSILQKFFLSTSHGVKKLVLVTVQQPD